MSYFVGTHWPHYMEKLAACIPIYSGYGQFDVIIPLWVITEIISQCIWVPATDSAQHQYYAIKHASVGW